MIDTKLILIEGIPGSGKSTTAWKLAAEIENNGRKCRYFLEWAARCGVRDWPLSKG